MTRSLNAMLGGDNQAAYERAQSAVEGADTVREAVEAVGVLEELDTELVVEARAVLDAIPPSLDQAIIGALESAFEDGAAVFIDWERGDTMEVRISEEPDGRVRIVFVSPVGSTYVDSD
jgi:hypothetical protein